MVQTRHGRGKTVKSLEEKKLLYVMRIKPVYGYSSTLDLYVKEG